MNVAGSSALPRRLRLLLLLPFPPDLQGSHGGARAIAAIIHTLSREHEVSALYLAPSDSEDIRTPPSARELIAIPAPRATNARKSIWRRMVSALSMLISAEPDWVRSTWSSEMAQRAVELATERKPDVVQFEFHVMAQYLGLIQQAAPGAALVVTEHEPGIVAAGEHGRGRNSIRQRLSGFARRCAWARFEREALAAADAVVTFTQKDRDAVRRMLPRSPVEVECIPLRLPLSSTRDMDQGPRIQSDLLFIGNFAHPPNVDAAKRLVLQIIPRVRQAIPSASLYVVGAHSPEELHASARPGVVVTGAVPHVAPYLRGASIVIVPLREGGGMRVKILEACAAGKAIIGSATAVEGLSLRPGVEFVAAESDDEFAAAAVELLRNPQARESLGQAAHAWAERTQDPDAWLAEYDALYRSLLVSRADHEA